MLKISSSSSSSRQFIISNLTSMSSSRFNSRGRSSWHLGFGSRPSYEENHQFGSNDGGNHANRQGYGRNYPNPRGGGSRPEYRRHPQSQFTPHPRQQFNMEPRPQFNYWHQQMQPNLHPQQQVNHYPRHQFRPKYTPQHQDDHRKWVFAASRPPPHCERFTVLSYNILADYLAQDHRSKLYFHIPRYTLDWEWRKKRLFLEFGLWSPDIMCLQEVDKFSELEEELSSHGYTGIWKMRTGNAVDGCAIFWRTDRFMLLHEEHIEFNNLGLRDNVSQICVLESRNQNPTGVSSTSSLESSGQSRQVNQVVVCNIHVLFNPRRGEIKLGQVRSLIDRASAISKLWNNAPVILCGDFNSTPMSHLYKFISKQKLDISGVPKDQISGQLPPGFNATGTYAGSGSGSYRPQHSTDKCSPEKDLQQNSYMHKTPQNDMENVGLFSNCQKLMGVDNNAKEENQASMLETGANQKSGAQRETLSGITCSGHNVNSSSNSNTDSSVGDSAAIQADSSVGDSAAIQASHSIQSMLDEGKPDESNCHECDSSDSELLHELEDKLLEENVPEAEPVVSVLPTTHEDLTANQIKSANDNKVDASLQKIISSENLPNGNTLDSAPNSSTPDDLGRQIMTDLHLDDFQNINSAELPNIDSDSNEPLNSEESSDPNFFSELTGTEDANIDKVYGVNEENSGITNFQDSELDLPTSIVDRQNIYNNPYLWTATEIEIASGNAECSIVEHGLKLRSAYTDVEDFAGTKGPSGEPEVTSYHRRFMGTVDYIWYGEGLQTVKVLDTIPKHILLRTPGFPTRRWGSDHLALVCELAFTKRIGKQSSTMI